MFRAMSHANAFERLRHGRLAIGRAHPTIGQRELNVFINSEITNQIEALEDEADLPVTNAGPLRKRKIRYLAAFEGVTAPARGIEKTQNRKQRRFPTARRTGNRDVLAVANIKVNAGECVCFHFISEKHFGHVLQLNKRVGSVGHGSAGWFE